MEFFLLMALVGVPFLWLVIRTVLALLGVQERRHWIGGLADAPSTDLRQNP